MQPRCKKCGRPLSNAESIARGMGPECAGIAGNRGETARVRKHHGSGATYNVGGTNKTSTPLFAWVDNENRQERLPDQLTNFPPDLVGLVLSAPTPGTIAARLKRNKRNRSMPRTQSPMFALKEIRRMCINLRMQFWPGFSFKGELLACIPCGDDSWRIGKDGREISVNDLVSYLSRYGAI